MEAFHCDSKSSICLASCVMMKSSEESSTGLASTKPSNGKGDRVANHKWRILLHHMWVDSKNPEKRVQASLLLSDSRCAPSSFPEQSPGMGSRGLQEDAHSLEIDRCSAQRRYIAGWSKTLLGDGGRASLMLLGPVEREFWCCLDWSTILSLW